MYLPCSSPDFSDDELDQRIKSSTDISTDTNTDTDQYQHSTRLPPGMTRADVSKHARTHTHAHMLCYKSQATYMPPRVHDIMYS